MITPEPLVVILVKLIDCNPLPPTPSKRRRGRPRYHWERLFLKALVIMIVQHLHKVHELLAVLDEPTAEMQMLRSLLTEGERYPSACSTLSAGLWAQSYFINWPSCPGFRRA